MQDQTEQRPAELETLMDQLEELLNGLGVTISAGSRLEQAMLLSRHIKYIREENAKLPDLPPDEEDDMLRRTTWLWRVVPRILAARDHKDFRQLIPHLKLLADGEFAQNVSGEHDQDADKLFELAVAVALLPIAQNVRLDTGAPKDRNPDLLFDFKGQRWGIACKALYTPRPERYRESIIKGASQIEASEAERGVVCVSLRNLVNQDLFMPRDAHMLYGVPSEAVPLILDQEEQRIWREVIEPVRKDIADDLLTRPKTEKAVIHVSAGCARTGSPEDVRLTYFAHLMHVGNVDEDLADALNAGLQALQPPLGAG